MPNFSCKREKRSEKLSQSLEGVDLTDQDCTYEANRCLRAMSCEACDLCRLLCPEMAITRDPVTGVISIDLTYCKGCGICSYICPKGAINMVLDDAI